MPRHFPPAAEQFFATQGGATMLDEVSQQLELAGSQDDEVTIAESLSARKRLGRAEEARRRASRCRFISWASGASRADRWIPIPDCAIRARNLQLTRTEMSLPGRPRKRPAPRQILLTGAGDVTPTYPSAFAVPLNITPRPRQQPILRVTVPVGGVQASTQSARSYARGRRNHSDKLRSPALGSAQEFSR